MWNRAANLTAARARLAELRRQDEAALRMVTPPEELPSWQQFDPRLAVIDRCVTRELLGDPGPERSGMRGAVPCVRPIPLFPIHSRAILQLDGCRFPFGDPCSSDFHFCNEATQRGSSYCARHAEKCRR